MRTYNSIKNSITSLIASSLAIIVGFISQTFFIHILGIEYMGLNGLFNNVLSMLNIFELGIGSSIIYNLYRPLKNNDIKTIQGLMNFYRKVYNIIAIIILVFGLLICPFLSFFVDSSSIDVNIYTIFILSLLGTVSSYFLTYKRSIINADQKNYIINIIHMIYLVLLNAFQLFILYFTKNFYIYLAIKIIFQILENLAISIYANKNYNYLKYEKKEKIGRKYEKDIFANVKALFLHKIGSTIVFGTDNLIISKYLSVAVVGLYSNYSMVINTLASLLSKFILSTTASVGNLCVDGNYKQKYGVYKKIHFINFLSSTFLSCCLLCLMQPFVSIWLGKKYLFSTNILLVLVINFFLTSMRSVYGVYRDSNGIWQKDKFIPLIESVINIILSIVLVKYLGLIGVFLGTIISGLIWWLYGFPKYVYVKIFKKNYINYFKEFFNVLVFFSVMIMISYFVISMISIKNLYLCLLFRLVVFSIIYILLVFILYHKNSEFNYIKGLIKRKFVKE